MEHQSLIVVVFILQACALAELTQGGGPGRGGASGAVCGILKSSRKVKIYSKGTLRHVESNGCPGYNWTDQGTPDSAREQSHAFTFPLAPVMNSGAGALVAVSSPVRGPIGVFLNGVSIYSIVDGLGRNALTYEGSTFDHCGGHPSPSGDYHYHVVAGDRHPASHSATRNNKFTLCPESFWKDTAGKHSQLLGFLADGIPLFGPQGDKGVVPTTLDACNGHTDATHKFYHYHATSNYPFLVNCLRGCVNKTAWANFGAAKTTCTPAAKQYDYTSLAKLALSKP
eukprot:jgi/Mesen1/942/ME000118S00120